MSTINLPPTSQDAPQPTDKEVEEELCLLDLEDADSLLEHVQDLISQHLDEFPEDQIDDEATRYAAKMTKASITDGTRNGHVRIIRHYITFHLRRNKKWDAKRVDEQTLRDITAFITQKCGPPEEASPKRESDGMATRFNYKYMAWPPNPLPSGLTIHGWARKNKGKIWGSFFVCTGTVVRRY
ncbi:hypothetical protein R3P38DRAFT_2780858 [Favolaschia claudopus]|uniref:Uncharacterized protein n=1 Tax=Favolaschia claudopus TaxID=2862362 RepID=A0AAW0B865_9AGAR